MSESSRDRTASTGIAAFLERFPPFRDLDRHHLSDLAEHVEIASYPPDTVVLRQTGEPSHRLFVVRSGIVDLTDEGRVVDRLGEGDVFGLSVLSDLAPALSVRARTETECYLIDADRARELLGTSAGLAFLGRNLARWRERDSVDKHLQRAGAGDALAGRSPARGTSTRSLRSPGDSHRRFACSSMRQSIRSTSATSWG